MPWLSYDGKTAAEMTNPGMVHGGSLPSELLHRRNPWADAMKAIAPGVAAYLKQKHQDAIANSLMNMEQPPRAEAVDPSLQGASATHPFTGGLEGFQANRMYQQYLQDQQNQQPDTAMNDLQYQHLYRQTHPEEFPDRSTGPQYVNTPNGRMTAHEWNVIQRDQSKTAARGVGGLTLDQLNQPDYVRYEDKDGNQISTEQANANPENAFAVPPNAKQRTPYKQWTSAADLFRQAQGRAGGNQPVAQGTSDNDSVLRDARDAINRGKDPGAVRKRLQSMGIDPALL